MSIARNRQEQLKGLRRAMIMRAAREAFAAEGLDGATMRGIAARCGYTPAAIYFYFSGKEEIYAAILSDVLDDLLQAMEEATRASESPEISARSGFNALYRYYRDQPEALELSYYLFQGVRPRGLTPELNRALNAKLQAILNRLAEALSPACGRLTADSWLDAVGCLVHVTGLLIARNTGRLKVLDCDADALAERYITELIRRRDP